MIYKDDRHPNPGELCTICSVSMHKRAALFFDKMRVAPSEKDREYDTPLELTFGVKTVEMKCLEVNLIKLTEGGLAEIEQGSNPNESASHVVACLTRELANMYGECGADVVPCYLDYTSFDADYATGSAPGIEAIMRGVPVLDDEKTSWEHILGFRSDEQARRKLRNLKLWLSNSLKCKSHQEAVDEIGRKLDDYEWALNKHGFKTITGTLNYLLNQKHASVAAGAAAAGTALGGPIGGALASGLVVAGQVSVWIADRMIDREDIKKGKNSEIAFIYDARKKFMKNDKST